MLFDLIIVGKLEVSREIRENGRLAQAYMRPLYGMYMAFIRPIHGLYTASVRRIYGLYTAYSRPSYGLYTAYKRPIDVPYTAYISLHLRMRQRTHFHAPSVQTNSFSFVENITVFSCPMSIYKFIFILSRNPFYQ